MANSNPGTYKDLTSDQLLKLVFDTREEFATRQLAAATLYQRIMPQVDVELQCDHVECAATNFALEVIPIADGEQFARAQGIQILDLSQLSDEDIAQLPGAMGFPEEKGNLDELLKDDTQSKPFNPKNPFGNLN